MYDVDDEDGVRGSDSESSSSHSDEENNDSENEIEEEDDDSDRGDDKSNPQSLLDIAGKKLLQLWTDDSDREYSHELWIDGEDDEWRDFNASCFPSDEEIYTVMTLGKTFKIKFSIKYNML